MQPGLAAHHRPPWKAGVLHQHHEGPAGGPDRRLGLQEPQADAASHRVGRGEDVDQLDVHLHVQLPQGEGGGGRSSARHNADTADVFIRVN